jgi:hypothetical protein
MLVPTSSTIIGPLKMHLLTFLIKKINAGRLNHIMI